MKTESENDRQNKRRQMSTLKVKETMRENATLIIEMFVFSFVLSFQMENVRPTCVIIWKIDR
jgi:hypothetical protein